MDPTIPKTITRLPAHAKGVSGNLREDLLLPAQRKFRVNYKEGNSFDRSLLLDAYKSQNIKRGMYFSLILVTL